MQSVRRGSRNGEQALAEHEQAPENIEAKADQEREVGTSKATLPIGHTVNPSR